MPEGARNKGERMRADDTRINQGDHMVSDWAKHAAATDGLATATRAASSGKNHYVTAIVASFSAASAAALTVKDGASSLFVVDVHDSEVIPLERPLEITKGNAVSAELAAGGAGIDGNVTLIGYTA